MSEKTINVLIIVDTYATVNGTTTVYMVDDNGDASQGSRELNIQCEVGDTINWFVTSILPTWGCVLTEFTPEGGTSVMNPINENGVWTAYVSGTGTNVPYTFTFTINGQPGTYTWDPYITVT